MEYQKNEYKHQFCNIHFFKYVVPYQENKNRYDDWCTKIKNNTIKSSKSNLFQIKNAFNDK